MAARRRRKPTGSTQDQRVKLVEVIVAELKEHGREGMKDRDTLLVRVIARKQLSRAQIERAAIDVVPLLKAIAARLRGDA